MTEVAKARTDPADLINAAVDALVRHRFELPALIALRRLAGTVHSAVSGAQWREVCDHLTAKQGSALEALLKVDSQTQESLFAQLCRAPGRASHKNLKMLIERHQWLQELLDPTGALQTIADSKVLQWANEAKRLKAGELLEYIKQGKAKGRCNGVLPSPPGLGWSPSPLRGRLASPAFAPRDAVRRRG